MRAFVLITCAILLGACSTPQAGTPPPSAVTLSEDLRFKWVPPNLSREMEVFISAGRYTRSVIDGDVVYYQAETGLVSAVHAGQPARKVK